MNAGALNLMVLSNDTIANQILSTYLCVPFGEKYIIY